MESNGRKNETIKWIVGLIFSCLVSVIFITVTIVNKTREDTLLEIKKLAEEARNQSFENKLSISALQAQMVMVLTSCVDLRTELKEINALHRSK